MRPIRLDSLTKAQLAELDHLYRTAREGRLRIRALMVLLAAERGMVAAQIAAVVREHEQTVRRWLVRYQAEGVAGLADAPRSGAPPEVTTAYRAELLAVVRRRPRSLGSGMESGEADVGSSA
jgi:transposase